MAKRKTDEIDPATDAATPEAPEAAAATQEPVPEPAPAPEPPAAPGPAPEPYDGPVWAKTAATVVRDGRRWSIARFGYYKGDDAAWLLAHAPELVEPYDPAVHR